MSELANAKKDSFFQEVFAAEANILTFNETRLTELLTEWISLSTGDDVWRRLSVSIKSQTMQQMLVRLKLRYEAAMGNVHIKSLEQAFTRLEVLITSFLNNLEHEVFFSTLERKMQEFLSDIESMKQNAQLTEVQCKWYSNRISKSVNALIQNVMGHAAGEIRGDILDRLKAIKCQASVASRFKLTKEDSAGKLVIRLEDQRSQAPSEVQTMVRRLEQLSQQLDTVDSAEQAIPILVRLLECLVHDFKMQEDAFRAVMDQANAICTENNILKSAQTLLNISCYKMLLVRAKLLPEPEDKHVTEVLSLSPDDEKQLGQLLGTIGRITGQQEESDQKRSHLKLIYSYGESNHLYASVGKLHVAFYTDEKFTQQLAPNDLFALFVDFLFAFAITPKNESINRFARELLHLLAHKFLHACVLTCSEHFQLLMAEAVGCDLIEFQASVTSTSKLRRILHSFADSKSTKHTSLQIVHTDCNIAIRRNKESFLNVILIDAFAVWQNECGQLSPERLFDISVDRVKLLKKAPVSAADWVAELTLLLMVLQSLSCFEDGQLASRLKEAIESLKPAWTLAVEGRGMASLIERVLNILILRMRLVIIAQYRDTVRTIDAILLRLFVDRASPSGIARFVCCTKCSLKSMKRERLSIELSNGRIQWTLKIRPTHYANHEALICNPSNEPLTFDQALALMLGLILLMREEPRKLAQTAATFCLLRFRLHEVFTQDFINPALKVRTRAGLRERFKQLMRLTESLVSETLDAVATGEGLITCKALVGLDEPALLSRAEELASKSPFRFVTRRLAENLVNVDFVLSDERAVGQVVGDRLFESVTDEWGMLQVTKNSSPLTAAELIEELGALASCSFSLINARDVYRLVLLLWLALVNCQRPVDWKLPDLLCDSFAKRLGSDHTLVTCLSVYMVEAVLQKHKGLQLLIEFDRSLQDPLSLLRLAAIYDESQLEIVDNAVDEVALAVDEASYALTMSKEPGKPARLCLMKAHQNVPVSFVQVTYSLTAAIQVLLKQKASHTQDCEIWRKLVATYFAVIANQLELINANIDIKHWVRPWCDKLSDAEERVAYYNVILENPPLLWSVLQLIAQENTELAQ